MFEIDNPCEKRWEAMAPRGEGRFCARCERVVVDLSRLTRAQAEARVKRRAGRTCLAVRRDVDTHAPVFRPEPSVAPRWAGGLVLAAALTGGGCAGSSSAATEAPQIVAEREPADPGPPMQPIEADRRVAQLEPALLTRAIPADELDLGPDSATPTAAQRALTERKHPPPQVVHTYLTMGF